MVSKVIKAIISGDNIKIIKIAVKAQYVNYVKDIYPQFKEE